MSHYNSRIDQGARAKFIEKQKELHGKIPLNNIMEKKQHLEADLRSVFEQLKKLRENYPNAWKVVNKRLTQEGSTTLTDADAALFYALEIIDETDF